MKTHPRKTTPTPLTTRLQGSGFTALLVAAAMWPVSARAQATWNTTTGNWSIDQNWDPAVVPLSDPATQLLFNGAGNYTTTNDVGAGTFVLNRLTVNHPGAGTVTIANAAAANTLTFAGANPTMDITGTVLFTGLMAGAATVMKVGPGTFIHDSNNAGFTGTLIINEGTFINRSTVLATTNFNPVSIVVNNGGTYQFGAANAGNPNLPNSTYVTINTGGVVSWQEGEDFGGFHLQGGTLVFQTSGANAAGSTAQNWSSGTVTGGAFALAGNTAINKTTTGTVSITGSASLTVGTGGLNIVNGAISMAGAANLGSGNVKLGDAAGTTAGTFDYQGATASRTGFFSADAGGGVINVASATTVLTLDGGLSGPGGLNKTGPGKLRVTGTLNETGTFTASAGTVQVEPASAFGGFVVAGGATLAVDSNLGDTSFSVPSLNLASGTAALQFDLNTNAVTSAPLAVINNPDGLTIGGTPTLRLTNLRAFANGTYTLLDYAGTPITSGFNLALPGRTLGSLVYDAVNTKIDVNISGTDTIKWSGAIDGTWDSGSAAGVGGTNNWKLVTATGATNFIDTDTVTLDDSATRFAINLVSTVQPFAITANASANYTIDGPGKLSGATALNKAGTGMLTLGTDNDFSGGTSVTQGTLQLGNGGAKGSVVGTITLNGGSLAFNRTDSYTLANAVSIAGPASLIQNGSGLVTVSTPVVIGLNTLEVGGAGNLTLSAAVSGAGALNKNGTGTLTLLANNNPFTGTLIVNGGTVLLEDLGGGGDLGAASIVVNNQGTFILGPTGNTDLPDTTVVKINAGGLYRIEQGENYGGFVLDGGEFRLVSTGKTGVNSTAIAPFDGATVYDVRSGLITTDFTAGSGGVLNQGGTNGLGVLTKSTSGTVTVSGSITFQAQLAMQIKEGTLAMGTSNFPSTGTVNVTLGDASTAGTMQINGVGVVSSARPFALAAGGGTIQVTDAASSVTLFGAVNGPGGLSKTGAGALVFISPNDYTGDTIVANGTLEVNNLAGSGTGSGALLVAGTLSGDGAIITSAGKGVRINGNFQVGTTGAFQAADFSITTGMGGSTTFGGASVALFDVWSSTGTDQSTNPSAADLLLVAGDLQIVAGATLKLTNPNGFTFQYGDVFRLLDLTGVGAVTGNWVIDATDLNLGSLTLDSRNLYTAGTLAVIPEPRSVALLALAGIAPIALWRRRPRGARASRLRRVLALL